MSRRRLPRAVPLSPSELEASARLTEVDFSRIAMEVASAGATDVRTASVSGAAGRPWRECPPLLTGGEHQGEAPEFVDLVLSDGSVKSVMRRTGPDRCGFVDWINFTISESTAHRIDWPATCDDADIINAISYALQSVFGFGVTGGNKGFRNFYHSSYPLGDGWGFLCHGGQRGTVLVMVSGEGVAAARPGWEFRLKHFLETIAINPKLTRVDVAYDCFNGEYTVDKADADFDAGQFRLSRSPKNPHHELRGNWREPDGSGRTIYIGRRVNGKFCRVYEKGLQLGALGSMWNRIEVEYKAVDRVIPFDILTSPGAYLSGAYPAFSWISEAQERITTTREQVACSKEKKERWISEMCGPDLALLHELEKGETVAEKALNLVNRLKNESKFPKWAKLPDYRFSPEPFLLMPAGSAAMSDKRPVFADFGD